MMNAADRVYNVNVRRLALLALPGWLRRPLAAALLYAGVSPLGRLVGELRAFRQEAEGMLSVNGQVCRLRGALNDMFDPEQRRIEIEEDDWAEARGWSRVIRREEGRWLTLGCRDSGAWVMVGRRGAGSDGATDFRVVVPPELSVAESRLRAVVNAYRLAGKRYELIYKQ